MYEQLLCGGGEEGFVHESCLFFTYSYTKQTAVSAIASDWEMKKSLTKLLYDLYRVNLSGMIL